MHTKYRVNSLILIQFHTPNWHRQIKKYEKDGFVEVPSPISHGWSCVSMSMVMSLHLQRTCFHKGVECNPYDRVYVYRTGFLETSIGKLVEVYEMPNCENKEKIVWFLCQLMYIFLASGEGKGKGLSNINPLLNNIPQTDVYFLLISLE
ncbi:hypothetical protein ACOSQ3_007783 [Xanthoceras sorbifolium]